MVQAVTPEASTNGEAAPQFIGTHISHLCSLLPRPLIMTGIFREILVRHFYTPEFIETPELKDMLWQSGERTNILIESVHRWRPELTEHRPAIILKRNAYQNRRIGIADRHNGSPTDIFGTEHFTTFWIGSLYFVLHWSVRSASRTACNRSASEVHHFHEVIRKAALLHRLGVTEVGAIAELEEAVENFVVPVTVATLIRTLGVLDRRPRRYDP